LFPDWFGRAQAEQPPSNRLTLEGASLRLYGDASAGALKA